MPPNPLSPDTPEITPPPASREPRAHAGGMKVLQPISQTVIPEPIAPRPEQPGSTTEQGADLGTESPSSQAYQPWNHDANQNASSNRRPETPFRSGFKDSSLNDRTERYARNDAIAMWLIIIIGLLVIGQSIYAIIAVYTSSTDHDANGFAGIVYSIQALLGLGFVFRVDTARRLLIWFTALILAFNIYTFLMASFAIFMLMGTVSGFLMGMLAIFTQLIIPSTVLIVLNLRSVKSAFGQ